MRVIMKKVLGYIVDTVIILAIAVALLYFYSQDYLKTSVPNEKVLFIPKGSTKSIINYLNKKGYNLNIIDYYFIKQNGYPQAGWINLKEKNLSRRVFFQRLTHSRAMGINITLIPGETTHIVIEQLAKKYMLSVTKLHTFYDKFSPYKEGVIFADSYTFYKGISEEKLMKILIEKSLKKHKELSNKLLKKYNQKEWFEKYITIASIITKEAASTNEMKKISSVIYNRLKKGMKLQMDGTLNHGKFSHDKVTPLMIKEDKSPFNTYKIKALPPYPVCIVEPLSVDAAINPLKTTYLYFMKKDSKSHNFSSTYQGHLKNIKK